MKFPVAGPLVVFTNNPQVRTCETKQVKFLYGMNDKSKNSAFMKNSLEFHLSERKKKNFCMMKMVFIAEFSFN